MCFSHVSDIRDIDSHVIFIVVGIAKCGLSVRRNLRHIRPLVSDIYNVQQIYSSGFPYTEIKLMERNIMGEEKSKRRRERECV